MNKVAAISFGELSATLLGLCVLATFLLVWFSSFP